MCNEAKLVIGQISDNKVVVCAITADVSAPLSSTALAGICLKSLSL